MGCSESKNVVEPDSKKPEEKPEEKTAIVPVTSKIEFPEINLTNADFAPENNIADLSPVFWQKEKNQEIILNPEKYGGTLETPRSSKIELECKIEKNQHSQKKNDENDYQLALEIEQEQLVQFRRMSTNDLLHIQNESAFWKGRLPKFLKGKQ